MQVPPVFVAATIALVAMTVAAVTVHLSMGSFSRYRGVSLLQEQLVRSSLAGMPSSTREMRIQGLAAKEENAEEEEAIRFENDRKVGGGDLMVPVSMVDYENLGEGSIVDQVWPCWSACLVCRAECRAGHCPCWGACDHCARLVHAGIRSPCATSGRAGDVRSVRVQRYPRKLPGADELEAEWNALWNWDWGSDDAAPAAPASAPPPPASAPQKQATKPAPGENNKLEDMGVNVNGYHKSGHK